MNWIYADLLLAPSVDREAFAAEIQARYGVDAAMGEFYIGNVPVELSYAASTPVMAAVFPDNHPLTRFRRAPLEAPESFEAQHDETGDLTGTLVRCWWNPQLLADLQLVPQPEWLAGASLL